MPSREFDFEDLNLKFLFNFDKFHLFFLGWHKTCLLYLQIQERSGV